VEARLAQLEEDSMTSYEVIVKSLDPVRVVALREDLADHRRSTREFHGAFTAIHDWLERTGERPTRYEREVYVDCDGPRDAWVTELQSLLEAKR
jgi:hypothetical protein